MLLVGLRDFLLDSTQIDHILVIQGGVFRGISVDNAILVVDVGIATEGEFTVIFAAAQPNGLQEIRKRSVSAPGARATKETLFTVDSDQLQSGIWRRIEEHSILLSELAFVNFGKQLRDRKKFTRDVIKMESQSQIQLPYRPCYTGRDVERYAVRWGGLACLDDAAARKGGCWDPERQNRKQKLLTRQIGKYPAFAMDRLGYQCLNTMFMINVRRSGVDSFFLIGILNSAVIRAYWLGRFYDQRRTFPKIKGTYLEQLPIPRIDEGAEVERVGQVVFLARRMVELHDALGKAMTPTETTVLQRHIDGMDRQIDQLVYELYGLTEEEIRIVEEGAQRA